MKRLVGKMLAWIGGIVVVLGLLLLGGAMAMRSGTKTVAQNTVLELDLRMGVEEEAPSDPIARLQSGDTPTLRDIVFTLERASKDAKVKGLFVHVGSSPMAPGHAQEIRDALLEFRKSKRFAIAFSEDFDGANAGLTSYYLASACDEIWLQPHSEFGVSGLRYESMFLRGALDKLGIVPRFEGRKEYKNAINTYLEKQFTAPQREAMQAMLDSNFGQVVRGVAAGRKLPEPDAKAALEGGPYAGERAVHLKLIDGLAYRDEAYAKAKKRAGKDAAMLWLNAYRGRVGGVHEKGKRVALIYGVGGIVSGKSGYDPMDGGVSMGSETVGAAFRKAIEDKDVKAIVFRVDSPGGSVVASETIWREVMRAKNAGKPVVVSMSSMAASGGYYVSMHADRIVAQPGTITGSIGVFTGKMVTKGLLDKLGVSFDSVQAGVNTDLYDSAKDFTPEHWAIVRGQLDRIYEQFTSKVAEGRKLPKEKVLEIARGRVWTGEDAKARGLVDELGGYPAALRAAKKLAKIGDGEDVELKVYPPAKTKLEVLLALAGGESDDSSDPDKDTARSMLRAVQPVGRLLNRLGVTGRRQGVLTLEVEGLR
ncbi:MAG TPA: signal peptide peptidase SppA [Paludibaculum sp.]|jgi:protease-4